MRKQGLADVRYVDARDMTTKEVTSGLKWCDIVLSTGWMGTNELMLLRRYQSLGLKVVIDSDDLHFNVSPFNPAYRHFGMDDVEVKNPSTGDTQFLWKDGVNGYDIKANKLKFHCYKSILQEADLITTTTVYLKDALKDIAGDDSNINVIPNAIDFSQWKPIDGIREKFKDKFRFGWAVSASHGEDWLFIKPALVKFLESHPDATFVCIGDTHMDIRTALPKGQVEWYPFSDLWEYHYPWRMAMLGLDCGIAPLANLEFNKCKSPLKYAEYTAFGWPTIAQDMEPYSSHIINGETGLLADSIDDWVRCLNVLYDSPDRRAPLRFNALAAVKDMFDLEQIAREWANAFKKLLNMETVKIS